MSNFIKTFITPKIAISMNLCDDHFAYNLDKLNFAVADGASCNLASRIYSRLLVDHFAEYGESMFSNEICDKMCEAWRSETDKMINYLGNPYHLRNMFITRAQAAATFAGIKIYRNESQEWLWDSFVLGDSVLIFIPEGENIPSILYTTNKPEFISDFTTDIIFNNNPKSAHPYNSQLWRSQVWEARNQKLNKGTFILMTDALAEWFILPNHKTTEEKFAMLMGLESDKDFVDFIDRERLVRLANNFSPLHDDDATLMILHIDDVESLSERNSIAETVKNDYRSIIEQCAKEEFFIKKEKEKDEIEQEYKEQLDSCQKSSRLQVEQLDKQLQEKNNKIIEQTNELNKLKEEKVHSQAEIEELKKLRQTNNCSSQHNAISLDDWFEDLKLKIIDILVQGRQDVSEVVEKKISSIKEEQSNIKDLLVAMPEMLVEQLKKVIYETADAFLQKSLKYREEEQEQEKKNNEENLQDLKKEIDELKKKNDLLINTSQRLRITLLAIGVIYSVSLIAIISIMIVNLFC